MTCGRVIIIDNGKIVAQDTTEGLRARAAQQATAEILVQLRLPAEGSPGARETPAQSARVALAALPGVVGVLVEDDAAIAKFRITAGGKDDAREAVFRLAVERGWILLEMRREVLTLEDIFVKLTAATPAAEA